MCSEYILWTDASSREFIAEHYSWFLDTFDNYTYPIQRADAIRYFVLYHFGGVYIDLDIGCLRPVDPLLIYPVILPKTIPVGVSNDLMFAERHHPLFEQTIHNLINFDHSWILNYPTVMFSTGPMFLSAQYGLYTVAHRNTAFQDIRILPKALYGKNAKEDEAPHSFFSHFYGSSWHSDDAAFIGFLGTWGKALLWIGLVLLIIGLLYIPSKQRRNFRRIGGYEILLPRITRSGRFHFHLRTPSSSSSQPSVCEADSDVSVLHIPFENQSTTSSPTYPLGFSDAYAGRTHSPLVETFQRVFNRVRSRSLAGLREIEPDTPIRTVRRTYNRGVLFFLPAFTQSQNIELQLPAPRSRSISPPVLPRYSPHPSENVQHEQNVNPTLDFGASRHFVPKPDSEIDALPLVILEDAPRSRGRTPGTPREP